MKGDKTTSTLDSLISSSYMRLGLDGSGKKRGGPRRGDAEHHLQAALIACIRVWDRTGKVWLPQLLAIKYPDLMDLYAVPNGGKRDQRTANKLKAEGVLAGVLDLALDVPRPANFAMLPLLHGLRLETKVPGNYPSKEQRALMERLVQRGYAVAVWRTLDEGLDLLVRYMEGRWEQTEAMLK